MDKRGQNDSACEWQTLDRIFKKQPVIVRPGPEMSVGSGCFFCMHKQCVLHFWMKRVFPGIHVFVSFPAHDLSLVLPFSFVWALMENALPLLTSRLSSNFSGGGGMSSTWGSDCSSSAVVLEMPCPILYQFVSVHAMQS